MGYTTSQMSLTTGNNDVKFKTQNAWTSRSKLEKALIIVSILCIGTVIGLSIAYGLLKSSTDSLEKNTCFKESCSITDSAGKRICLEKSCIKAANNLIESIDFNVQPCDDFYQYACGNWMKKNIILEDHESFSQFSVLRDDLEVTLKNIFEDKNPKLMSKSDKMIKDSYDACMNEESIENLKSQPLINTLDQVIGGWSLLIDNWDPSKFDWIYIVANTTLYGESYFIQFDVSPDSKNISNNIITLDQTSFGLDRNYLSKEEYDKQRKAYETYIVDVATLLYNGTLHDQQIKDISRIVSFERELVNITKPPEERRNETRMYNKMSLAEIQARSGNIDFKRYFSLVFPSSITIADDEPVVVKEVEYYEELLTLLAKTDKRIIANYIGWRFAQRYVWHLSKEFRLVRQKYLSTLIGTLVEKARWRICVNTQNDHFGLAVGMLYVKNNFLPASKEAMDLMIKNLKVSFKNILQDNEWMDEQTKKFAFKKLDKMNENIGYPKEYENPEEVDKEYDGLIVSAEDHFMNILISEKFMKNYQLKELRTGFNKTRWVTTPAIVNAYYEPNHNSIYFPAGILQRPYFDAERPRSMNYGAIGMAIGHEITHGFDDQGRQFDSDGNLYQWWANEAEKRFSEKAACIINQYSSYSVPKLNISLNGVVTQGENIADNGGVKEAYMAYKNSEEKNGLEPLLPGLNFTHDQLFFLSFANIWCINQRDESLRKDILGNEHSPGNFRVIGSLANSLEFRAAFNCQKGSNMYREERCSVW